VSRVRTFFPAPAAVVLAATLAAGAAGAEEPGWIPLFDGKSLDGWHIGTKTGHGTGGKWFVLDGAIHGTQDRPGNGGIVLTDRQFGDFEVALEMNSDYVPDSGLFLRSTEEGRCYQAMIDWHPDGNLMGIYGEGTGGFVARNFLTLGTPDAIRILEHPAYPCPFTPEGWKSLWKTGAWNALRARIRGNPPTIETWINGVQVMRWADTEKRLPDRGGIALQVHGGGDLTKHFVRYRNIRVRELEGSADPDAGPVNALSDEERASGWQLLFDGKTLGGWKTDTGQPSRRPVEDGALNPHRCGGYMLIHEKEWGDFILTLEFKLSPGCNSGVFFRTFPLEPKPGGSVGYNGLEVAIDDQVRGERHNTGAIYDLVPAGKNAMKPAGEWNRLQLTCDRNIIQVALNGEFMSRMDVDEWKEPGKRPDGTAHKFAGVGYARHPRHGYIGLQDHGADCWYRNIKIRPLR
jgi:hypothetical protein